MLLPALKPACSSVMIFFACGFSPFSMIFSMTLHQWLMRLIVQWFWHCCRSPFLGNVMTRDWVHRVVHSPVRQILLQIVVRAVITSSPPAWISSAGMLSTPADFPFFSYCIAASTCLRRMGWSSSVSVRGHSSTDGSLLALWLYSLVHWCKKGGACVLQPAWVKDRWPNWFWFCCV